MNAFRKAFFLQIGLIFLAFCFSHVNAQTERIDLFLETSDVSVNVWQFTWIFQVPFSVNVTIVNESFYTSTTMFYRIINLDTNETIRDWSTGETVLIEPNANTTITIISTIPIQRNFEREHFRVHVKLSLIREAIEAETDFTVEKDTVKQFFGNVALLGLCVGLVGVAVYSYKEAKPKPWKKYPTLAEQKRKKYPERKGRK